MAFIKNGDPQPIVAVYEVESNEEFDVETRKQLEIAKTKVGQEEPDQDITLKSN